ncbi:MAG TPA: hypothetical protein VLS28_01615 [Candidatus Sulfomarinibacteraceae bacterium]|nr:hypothetical protein [Candidatus Sulfomarinibacteraceae bacterium]
MRRYAIRIAGPLTGIVLAVVIGAAPALAAPARQVSPAASPAGAPGQAEELNARRHCVREWRAAKAEPTVEHLRAVGLCEIDRRLVTIQRLEGLVDGARALTEAHATALEAILDHSAAGLRALRAEIEADATVGELRADIEAIFSDFRIYALVTRQVHLVRAADTVDAAAVRLDGLADRLAAAIEEAAASGNDVTEARAHLGAMRAAIDAAQAEVAGDADAVLVLTPAGWNAGTAKPVLDAAHRSVVAARADLKTALAEARAVRAALR